MIRYLALFLLLSFPALAQIPPPPQDVTFSASCTAACTTAVITTSGYAQVSVAATGTGSGMTFAIEGQDASGTWRTLAGVVPDTPGTFVTSMSANGIWVVGCASFQRVRVNLSVIGGGTETFSLEASVRTNVGLGK